MVERGHEWQRKAEQERITPALTKRLRGWDASLCNAPMLLRIVRRVMPARALGQQRMNPGKFRYRLHPGTEIADGDIRVAFSASSDAAHSALVTAGVRSSGSGDKRPRSGGYGCNRREERNRPGVAETESHCRATSAEDVKGDATYRQRQMYTDRKPQIYWVTIDIVFNTPLPIFEENGRHNDQSAQGAYMELGVTARFEDDAEELVASLIAELTGWDRANYSIVFDRVAIISKDALQSEIYGDKDVSDSLLQDPQALGVWYRTGFGFYSDK